MKIAGLKIVGAFVLMGAVAGCDTSSGIGRLFAGNEKSGPDEFGIVPTKPLEMPKDYKTLPEPTPGARNLTDPLPEQDAVAALGGRPKLLDSTAVNRNEAGLLAATGRNGTGENIRDVLAAEDKEYRKKNKPRFLERLFKINTYLRNYEPQTLPARRTNELARRKGIKTPTVSPEVEE
jgi:hypothetical protein